MAKIKTKYVCQSCGYESAKWMGRCPGCNEWNTLVEEFVEEKKAKRGAAFVHSSSRQLKPERLSDVVSQEETFERGILFDIFTILIECRRTDTLKFATCE